MVFPLSQWAKRNRRLACGAAIVLMALGLTAWYAAFQVQQQVWDDGKREAEDAEWAAAERACIEDPGCSYDKFEARKRIEYDCECYDGGAAVKANKLLLVGAALLVVAMCAVLVLRIGARSRPEVE